MIVDVNFEAHPVVISSIRLDLAKAENCSTTLPDHTGRPMHLLDDCEPIKELL